MTKFDINKTAGNVFSIAGMGIGLGMLAVTAKRLTHITDDMYHEKGKKKKK